LKYIGRGGDGQRARIRSADALDGFAVFARVAGTV
jgi:hypothetical protein